MSEYREPDAPPADGPNVDPWGYMRDLGGTDRGTIGNYYGRALGYINDTPKVNPWTGKAMSGAESGMWQGVANQQRQMGAAANRRGWNPGMARTAAYAGGELESRGHGIADQLRAMQEQQRRQLLMAAAQKRSSAEQAQMGIDETMLGEQAAMNWHYIAMSDALGEEADASMQRTAVNAANTASNTLSAGAKYGSDRRMKVGASEAPTRDQDELIRAAKGHTYEYKPGVVRLGLGREGERYSPMAQDLEGTRLGRTLVIDTPAGKVVDGQAATGVLLGVVGRLGERIDDLERGRPK